KIGDIFSVEIAKSKKRYFQYISIDKLQLNSDVIRIFRGNFESHESLDIDKLKDSGVESYIHCFVNQGIKMNIWKKEGYNSDLGLDLEIVFRSTDDYGGKVGSQPLLYTNNWHIWQLGKSEEKAKVVSSNLNKLKCSHIGIVINPLGILEILKGNKYPPQYPEIGNILF
ncbi:MAG TPA: hypothetical protein PK977_01535, partial [Chitinophagaceae bacterium]|nr:hypothetical protein [Chitinophagaceae bacterium]